MYNATHLVSEKYDHRISIELDFIEKTTKKAEKKNSKTKGKKSKNMKAVTIIAISVVIVLVAGYVANNSFSNLQQMDEEKLKILPVFEESMQVILEICESSEFGTKAADAIKRDICKKQLQYEYERCGYFGNPPICGDPRIKKYLP